MGMRHKWASDISAIWRGKPSSPPPANDEPYSTASLSASWLTVAASVSVVFFDSCICKHDVRAILRIAAETRPSCESLQCRDASGPRAEGSIEFLVKICSAVGAHKKSWQPVTARELLDSGANAAGRNARSAATTAALMSTSETSTTA